MLYLFIYIIKKHVVDSTHFNSKFYFISTKKLQIACRNVISYMFIVKRLNNLFLFWWFSLSDVCGHLFKLVLIFFVVIEFNIWFYLALVHRK